MAICFMLLGCLFYLKAFRLENRSTEYLYLAALFVAISASTQLFGLFPSFVFSLLWLFNLWFRKAFAFRDFFFQGLLSVSLVLFWMMIKYINFGSPFATQVSQFSLLKADFGMSKFYLQTWTVCFAPVLILFLLRIPFFSFTKVNIAEKSKILFFSCNCIHFHDICFFLSLGRLKIY